MSGIAPDASDLCTHCGLCCDGTLFDRATAYPQDKAGLVRHAVPFDFDTDTPVFLLGCPRLDGATCTIYPERFVTCRGFRCTLLKKLDRGEIDLAQGLATIASARTLVAAVEPEARAQRHRHVVFDETSRWQSLADPAARPDMARRNLAIVVLERFLKRHFDDNPPKAEKTAS